jgi:hypothetical protein
MKVLGITLVVFSIICLTLDIFIGVKANYKLEKDIMCNWELADKASTITQKSEYIDKFVKSLEDQKYQGTYNAIVFQTPNNSFDENMKALKSLQSRLHEIQEMNPSSFEYQTAIQQITQQEQGEAQEMLSELKGLWFKNNYPFLWDWICLTQVLFLSLFLIVGCIIVVEDI